MCTLLETLDPLLCKIPLETSLPLEYQASSWLLAVEIDLG